METSTKTTKRESAILEATQEGNKIKNVIKLVEQDVHSLKGLLHAAEGKKMTLETTRDSLLASPTIPLGESFVNTLADLAEVEERISLINKAYSYVS